MAKIAYTEQYDATLTKAEMLRLHMALRVFVRDYEATEDDELLLATFDELVVHDTGGRSVTLRALTLDSDEPPAAAVA